MNNKIIITKSKREDVIGNTYGYLKVLEDAEDIVSTKGIVARMVLCECKCGNNKVVRLGNIKHGKTVSCGCFKKENPSGTKHGMSTTRIYKIWKIMKKRCSNKNTLCYKNYGERGIKVCDDWINSFENFNNDMNEGYSDKLTIDRIDNNKGYSKENCRWATMKEQNNNRSNNRLLTFNGKTQTMSQWADETGINKGTISSRINRDGLSVGDALSC